MEHKQITQVTRSLIVDSLVLSEREFHGRLDLMSFLKRIWDLSSMPSKDYRFQNAEGDIWQHMVRNHDWDYSHLLCDRLDLLGCEDRVFFQFLEICLHPLVVESEEEANALAADLNKFLEKDGYRLVITLRISGRAVFSAVNLEAAKHVTEDLDVYEIVLSFAGEEREYVERVADYLRERDVLCFYDRYEDVTLWGKDLAEHLHKVYSSARFCVMFISRSYAEKVWTTHERRSALAHALEEKGEYILPARFDDTEIPGLRHTIGYVDLRIRTPEELGTMIIRKLGRRSVSSA